MTPFAHAESGLEKALWTEADEGVLGWHDARIVAVALVEGSQPGCSRFLLDIDYLVRWVAPEAPARFFSFWITPATLVFEDVWSLSGELDHADLSIDCITRLTADPGPGWHIDGHTFDLRLVTWAGFTLFMRRPPILVDRQCLSLAQRGGISFEESTFEPCFNPPVRVVGS
jgi:hypothetical protein